MSQSPFSVASGNPEPGLSPGWIAALIATPIAMLLIALFGFRQLYQLWCRASGTQLRPNSTEVANGSGHHTGRYIKIYFEANVSDSLPVTFEAADAQQMIEVGMDGRNFYRLRNRSSRTVRMRPVHFISPINASGHFGMKVCFCFKDQVLGPGESREYPVVFTFAPSLDERIHTVSICYTLFALTGTESEEALDQRIQVEVGKRGTVVSPRRPPAAVPLDSSAPLDPPLHGRAP